MNTRNQHQGRTPCVIMRGGTSRALFFHERDLPPPGKVRDALLVSVMGSPDLLQVDGLGGSRPITSKVAIVAPSQQSDADIDYTFGQVEIGKSAVNYDANCGNISSAVAPFAIEEGLLDPSEPLTRVRIRNMNTQKILIADVPVTDGRVDVYGDFSLPGISRPGAEIRMNWIYTVGASTGKLLPTGRVRDFITFQNGKTIEATLCDAANSCVWVRAEDFGLTGGELSEEINDNASLLNLLGEVRAKAAVLFGLCSEWRNAAAESPTVPMIGLAAPSADYLTLTNDVIGQADIDLRVRLIFMGRLHESIAGTGSICLGAASRIPGSVVHELCTQSDGIIRIGHPSGVTPARVQYENIAESPFVKFSELGFSRSARRLMAGEAYFPIDAGSER